MSENASDSEHGLGSVLREYSYNPRAWTGPFLAAIVIGLIGLFFAGLGATFIITRSCPIGTPHPNAILYGCLLSLSSMVVASLGYVYYRYWLVATKHYGLRLFEQGFSQKFSGTTYICRWQDIIKVRYIVKGGPILGSMTNTDIMGLEILRQGERPLVLNLDRLDYTVFPEVVEQFKEHTKTLRDPPEWEKGFSFDLFGK